LTRSACSSALNYGEALGAGTTKDRINKLRITLKELRESLRNLRIQSNANLIATDRCEPLQSENNELIRIVETLIKKTND
jgi:four helix bundle protein